MKKLISILALGIITGCSTNWRPPMMGSMNRPPIVEGYIVLGFRQPKPGELMWKLGNEPYRPEMGRFECWVIKEMPPWCKE